MLTLKSWQHGFTAACDLSAADRARHDALFLKRQAYCSERVTASHWKRCLAAFDDPMRWIEIARWLEREERLVEANAALAAARWLDASPEVRAMAALPARLRLPFAG